MRPEPDWKFEIEQAFDNGGTWFTSQLLRLIDKADRLNREKLRMGFPAEVAAWERWMYGEGEFAREKELG